jgi:alkylation response protein AidB-like acyl-CoA dehydrogenase
LSAKFNNSCFNARILLFKDSHPEIQRYLPDIARGKIIGAFAMSEASSGSNPHEILACAKKIKGGFLLSADKRWIGSAAWSGLILVFAKVEKEVNAINSPSGMTAFLVKTESEGVKIGEEALTFGVNALIQSDLTLENVFVPDSMVIGHIGRGFEIAARAMMLTRVAVAAAAIGAMLRGLQIAEQFTKHRKIGSVTLADFETTTLFLQKISADILLLERTIAAITKKLDQEDSIPSEVYTALKYVSAEWSWQAIDTVMQRLGARGHLESNPVAQLLADVRLFRIFEGTSETMADFLGKRALNSTLTPGLLQEAERNREIDSPTLIQEFEEFLLALRGKNHQSTSSLQAGTINSQVAGRLLSILIIENILLESFKEDNDFYLKSILLNRLKDHFRREKQAFTNSFAQAISNHTYSLISKVCYVPSFLRLTVPRSSRPGSRENVKAARSAPEGLGLDILETTQ